MAAAAARPALALRHRRAWPAPTARAVADAPAPPRWATPPAAPAAPGRTSGGNACACPLFQLDIVVDGVGQVDAADGQRHLGRQGFIALELAARHRGADGLLDLALRGDADGFEKS